MCVKNFFLAITDQNTSNLCHSAVVDKKITLTVTGRESKPGIYGFHFLFIPYYRLQRLIQYTRTIYTYLRQGQSRLLLGFLCSEIKFKHWDYRNIEVFAQCLCIFI